MAAARHLTAACARAAAATAAAAASESPDANGAAGGGSPPSCDVPPPLELSYAKQQLRGPGVGSGEAEWDAWFGLMLSWRRSCRSAIRYGEGEALYDANPAMNWTSSSFMQPQAHLFDRYLYNESTQAYTVDRYLDDLNARFGGIDSVLLWPTCEEKSPPPTPHPPPPTPHDPPHHEAHRALLLFELLPTPSSPRAYDLPPSSPHSARILLPPSPTPTPDLSRLVPLLYWPTSHPHSSPHKRAYPTHTRTRTRGADPNIGLDGRNQFDMIAAAPGGLPALRKVVEQFHSHGVRVLWPLKPWDKGTRRDALGELGQAIQLLEATGADGLNGDTFPWVPREYFDQALRVLGRPIALEPELGGVEYDGRLLNTWLNWHTMSWGYWAYPPLPEPPLVARWKWFEPRHMTHVCDRWQTHRTDNLQAAWFNGVGYETWENVWGTWNGLTPRDAETVRRLGRALHLLAPDGYLTSKLWVPHTRSVLPTAAAAGVFASAFPRPTPPARPEATRRKAAMAERGAAAAAAAADHHHHQQGAASDVFIALVNRGSESYRGPMLALPAAPGGSPGSSSGGKLGVRSGGGTRFWDVLRGTELTPVATGTSAGGEAVSVLSLSIEPGGFGGVLASSSPPSARLRVHLAQAAADAQTPLAAFDDTWRPLRQTIVPVMRTRERVPDTPSAAAAGATACL